MNPDQNIGKTLKDYSPTDTFPAQDISGSAPMAARPYEGTTGENAGNVFDQRGSQQSDAPPIDPEGVFHPWKVTPGELDETWDVVGDKVWGQGLTITVADTTLTGDPGWILLKVVRDSESREMTSASLQFSATVPESDYTDQYRVIAYINTDADEHIMQYQFEEIRIFEDLTVVNGEFRLAALEMSHRNYYEPPP